MKIQDGDSVAVRYTGRLESGDVFDTNDDGSSEPLVFQVGSQSMIAGFERAVIGLSTGDSTTARIPPEEAYGTRDENLISSLARKLFEGGELEVGLQVDLEDAQGQMYEAHVIAFDDETVTVDFNHPLAGHALTFDIRIESIDRP